MGEPYKVPTLCTSQTGTWGDECLNFITRSNLNHEILLFDVGHGDCTFIIDSVGKGLLIDCGSLTPHSYFKIPSFIESLLPANNQCGFVVSHYHWDHYSLFTQFKKPQSFFSTIFLPDLPTTGLGTEASLAMKDFLMMSAITGFSHYKILPEIFARTNRPVVYCKEGTRILEAGLQLRVFWPKWSDPCFGTKRVREKAATIRESIEPMMDQYGIPKPSDFEGDLNMESFFRVVRDYSRDRQGEINRQKVYAVLEEIENAFRDLADLFSIAFRTHYKRKSRCLFLGDLSGRILDKITIPGTSEYDVIKAAHHGTRFGNALEGMTTDLLLISRSEKHSKIKRIHDGYLHKMQYNMLLSTGFLGDCDVC